MGRRGEVCFGRSEDEEIDDFDSWVEAPETFKMFFQALGFVFAAIIFIMAMSWAMNWQAHSKEYTQVKPGSVLYWKLYELTDFVHRHTKYTSWEMPRVFFRTQKQINDMCGNGLTANACERNGVIFLLHDFTPGRDDFILVHELTHFQQFEAGMFGKYTCPQKSEPEAYEVQAKFVDEHPRPGSWKGDPFTVYLIAKCQEEMMFP